jgi:hypothetical protein
VQGFVVAQKFRTLNGEVCAKPGSGRFHLAVLEIHTPK